MYIFDQQQNTRFWSLYNNNNHKNNNHNNIRTTLPSVWELKVVNYSLSTFIHVKKEWITLNFLICNYFDALCCLFTCIVCLFRLFLVVGFFPFSAVSSEMCPREPPRSVPILRVQLFPARDIDFIRRVDFSSDNCIPSSKKLIYSKQLFTRTL